MTTDPSVADDPLFSIPLSRLNELSARGAKLREIENALRGSSDGLIERLGRLVYDRYMPMPKSTNSTAFVQDRATWSVAKKEARLILAAVADELGVKE